MTEESFKKEKEKLINKFNSSDEKGKKCIKERIIEIIVLNGNQDLSQEEQSIYKKYISKKGNDREKAKDLKNFDYKNSRAFKLVKNIFNEEKNINCKPLLDFVRIIVAEEASRGNIKKIPRTANREIPALVKFIEDNLNDFEKYFVGNSHIECTKK